MENREPFNYIGSRPYLRTRLNKIMQRINKLNIAKLNYSIQELQSLDVLDDRRIEECQRILEETNEFLNSVEDLGGLQKSNAKDPRIKFGEFLEKRDVDDKIEINVSNLKKRTFTIADTSFKANKYTKWLCHELIDLIAMGNGTKKNESFGEVLSRLKGIYNKSNTENNKKVNVEDELKKLSEEIEDGQYKGWDEIFIGDRGNNQEILQCLYSDLVPVWDLESTLYEIKNQLNKQLVRCLIQDNYSNFKNWGFEKDEKGNWILNFDPEEVAERYSFHVPELGKILSKSLVKQITTYKKLKYTNTFTSKIRKNSLDRIHEKVTGKEFLGWYKDRFVSLLRKINLEQLYEEQYELVQELYIMGKFMTEGNFKRISEEFPELSQNCELLKELISPNKISRNNATITGEVNQNTEYEDEMREQIEKNLTKYRTIFIQYGNNLDKNASIYALRRHMRDKFGITDIKVVEINAGEKRKENTGLIVDAGNLLGNNDFTPKFEGTKGINANVSRAQKSACGILSQYGIYVPTKIVQYADTVISDERALIARHGVNLIRNLKNKALFDFAEARREDGTYLIETELTDEELKKWHLEEQCKKREEEIKRSINQIKDNIYTIKADGEEKHIAIVNSHVNCGAMISYGLGCDYYLSIAEDQADFMDDSQNFFETDKSIPKVTFSITANPKKGDGKLPDSIIKWCEELRDKGENDKLKMITVGQVSKKQKPFIKPTKDMAVFGGLKAPNLFVTLKDNSEIDDEISDIIMYEITDRLGATTTKPSKKREIIEKNIEHWKNIRAKTLVEEILQGPITLTDVQNAGQELFYLSKEGREENGFITN